MKRRSQKADTSARRSNVDSSDVEPGEFARAMADVNRLAPDPRGRARAKPVSSPRTTTPRGSPSGGEDPNSSEAEFVASGVDRRELRKLKRGEYVSGSQLDLHGQTGAEAIASVKAFIGHSRHRHRCVSIVHGRGLHSAGNVSILRTLVRQCLAQHAGVLAYADAPRRNGGAGAVYILLRK